MHRQTTLSLEELRKSLAGAKSCADGCVGRLPLGLVVNEIGVVLHTSEQEEERIEAGHILAAVLSGEIPTRDNPNAQMIACAFLSNAKNLTTETKEVCEEFVQNPDNAVLVSGVDRMLARKEEQKQLSH